MLCVRTLQSLKDTQNTMKISIQQTKTYEKQAIKYDAVSSCI